MRKGHGLLFSLGLECIRCRSFLFLLFFPFRRFPDLQVFGSLLFPSFSPPGDRVMVFNHSRPLFCLTLTSSGTGFFRLAASPFFSFSLRRFRPQGRVPFASRRDRGHWSFSFSWGCPRPIVFSTREESDHAIRVSHVLTWRGSSGVDAFFSPCRRGKVVFLHIPASSLFFRTKFHTSPAHLVLLPPRMCE